MIHLFYFIFKFILIIFDNILRGKNKNINSLSHTITSNTSRLQKLVDQFTWSEMITYTSYSLNNWYNSSHQLCGKELLCRWLCLLLFCWTWGITGCCWFFLPVRPSRRRMGQSPQPIEQGWQLWNCCQHLKAKQHWCWLNMIYDKNGLIPPDHLGWKNHMIFLFLAVLPVKVCLQNFWIKHSHCI